MVTLGYKDDFKRRVKRLDDFLKSKIYKQVEKIIQNPIQNPEIGKPMRYGRKGTRELHVKSFRLSYVYVKEKDKIILLDLYHKDNH